MYRNPSANLSPTELASLRRVYRGLIHTVPRGHRDLFISMTFAAAHDMTKHRPIVWWVSVYEVTQQLGIHQDDKTVAAVQQAVDLHLLRANSKDDPGMICVTYDGIRLVEKG